jgi:hypothetical protein
LPVTSKTLPFVMFRVLDIVWFREAYLDSHIAEFTVLACPHQYSMVDAMVWWGLTIALCEKFLGDGIALRRVELDWLFGFEF